MIFNFEYPYLGILILIILILWISNFYKIGIKTRLYLHSWNIYSFKRLPLKHFIALIGIVSWLLLGYAIMRPRSELGELRQEKKLNDIFFVVDISRSMLANDFDPNRLEMSKKKIKDFIGLAPSDRIGIILFSEKIYTLLPLTTDLTLAKEIIDEIHVGPLGSGTNIGDALGLAVAREKDSKALNKVIILLTDGVSQVDSLGPIEAAHLAKDANIKVYTIAIGQDNNAKIPLGIGPMAQIMQKIPGGSIDLDTLEKIASISSGRFFMAKDEQALKEIFQEIQALEKITIGNESIKVYQEYYYYPLLVGVILLIVTELLNIYLLREVL